jgi:hypothetical protein
MTERQLDIDNRIVQICTVFGGSVNIVFSMQFNILTPAKPLKLERARLEQRGTRSAQRAGRLGTHLTSKDITDTADGFDQARRLSVRLDLAPQTRDMSVNGPIQWGPASSLEQARDLIAGEHACRPSQKDNKEIELGIGQFDYCATRRFQLPARNIKDLAFEFKTLVVFIPSAWCRSCPRLKLVAPKHRTYPQQYLPNMKWLCNVIVRSLL